MYMIKKARVLQNGEILLPNGKTLGNRRYNKYYKQTDFYKEYIQINQYQREKLLAIKFGSNQIQTRNEETKMALMERKMRVDQILKTKQNLAHNNIRKRYLLSTGIQGNKILYLRHNWRRQYGV